MFKKFFIVLLLFSTPQVEMTPEAQFRPRNSYEILKEEAYLSPQQQAAVQILSKHPNLQATEGCFTKQTLTDFELIKGRHKEEYTLLSRINRTESVFGFAELARMLITPSDQLAALEKKQKIIHQILEHEQLFRQLDEMLKEFKKIEPVIMTLFAQERDEVIDIDEVSGPELFTKGCTYQNVIKNYTFLLPQSIKQYLLNIAANWDKSPRMLESLPYAWMTKEFLTYGLFAMAALAPIVIPFLSNNIKKLYGNDSDADAVSIVTKFTTFKEKMIEIFWGTKEGSRKIGSLQKGVQDLLTLGTAALGPATAFFMFSILYKHYKKFHQAILQAHANLIKVGTFLSSKLKATDIVLQENLELQESMPELVHLHEIITNSKKLSEDLQNLMTLFNSSTFKGQPNSIFSFKGRMLAIYNLLKTEKQNLIPLLSTIGKLDAYLSLTKLYKEADGYSSAFCFPTYRTSAIPTLIIKDFWNPFVKREKAITNSIEPACDGKGRCYVFTGPNAGGKSTSMKGVGLNIILAQTCGISPSRQLELTPFSYIDSHLDITDDIASQKSLYIAEGTRIKEILDNIQALPRDKFSFLIIDELFNSTNSDSGSAIDRAIGQFIARRVPNCVCIIASHLSDITKLETDTNGIFRNYKVTVEKVTITDAADNPKTVIVYPYTLYPGIANQSIAIDILSTLNFEKEIIDISQHLYDEKVKLYKALTAVEAATQEIVPTEQQEVTQQPNKENHE